MNKKNELEKKLHDSISQNQITDGFIKITDNPVEGLTSEQKVILNRKANTMFNSGNIEDARRIYITTGYSDGLTRVGNHYMGKNEPLKALKVYHLAHNKRNSEPIYENIARVISALLKDN